MRAHLLGTALVAICLSLSPAAASAREAPRSVVALVVTPSDVGASAVFVPVEGADRIETAIAASKLAFTGTAGTVVLCTGWNWPDALGGSALAGARGGPLLLTRPDTLSPAVVSEVRRLDAREMIIIGSGRAISPGVESALRALDVNGHSLTVTRVAGDDRFETSALVASATVEAVRSRDGTYTGTAFFATGANFPDALAASPIAAKKGWPILLVGPSGLTTPTEEAIGLLGIRRGIMLGSKRAVSAAVAGRLATLLAAPPERLEGADRYLTAVQIACFGVSNGLSWDGVGIATGQNFPDALAGGVMQGRLGSVLLLTPPEYLRTCVFDELASRRHAIHSVRYLGSIRALRQYVRDGVTAALNGEPYPQTNGMLFPVDGPCDFQDTFGAPRSGGRTHEGTDIMAARGTPVIATVNGTVSSKDSGLGGRVIYLDGDSGWRFYYAHLSDWAVTSGWVEAGTVIGYVGNTGNASGGACHLHLQMWTPQGALVNPYSYLLKMPR
jgi:putative cell wall-binding protein